MEQGCGNMSHWSDPQTENLQREPHTAELFPPGVWLFIPRISQSSDALRGLNLLEEEMPSRLAQSPGVPGTVSRGSSEPLAAGREYTAG